MRGALAMSFALLGCGGSASTPSTNAATIVDGSFEVDCLPGHTEADGGGGGGSATLQLSARSDGTWVLRNVKITLQKDGPSSTVFDGAADPSSISVHAGTTSVPLRISATMGQDMCAYCGFSTWYLDVDIDTGTGIVHVTGTPPPSVGCAVH